MTNSTSSRTRRSTPVRMTNSTSSRTRRSTSSRSSHSVGDLSGDRAGSRTRGCTFGSRHGRGRTPHGLHGSLDVSFVLLVLVQTRLDLFGEIRVPVREVLDPLVDAVSRL